MRRFLKRALEKVPRMTNEQIRSLLDLLADENERLESVMDSMTDGIIVCDPSDNLILVNKSAERLLPIMGGETQDKPVWLFIDDDEVSTFLKASLENHDRVADREFTIEMKGIARTLSLSLMPLVSLGRIRGSLLHIEDVSEKRSREARLRRAESLASLTTLTAGVAHEIKNPLASISIHIQLAAKAMQGKEQVDTKSISHYLGIVGEEVERLNRIVVDFLFAVRPIDLNLVESDLNDFVRDTMSFLKYELDQSGIGSELSLAEGLPRLMIDARFMKQALLNLIKNAIEAMPSGGNLKVSTFRKGDEIDLSVEDTGVGMSAETQAKIFEPFFTTREAGSGLGLTTVFKIVKEHQGEIQVKSKLGEGTTFTLILPVPQRERRLIGYGANE
jgi:two-component system, sporulation sensor kinase E